MAHSEGVDQILSDDEELCREAASHGLTCLEAPGVVLLMKRRGLVPAVRPVLDRMRHAGFGIAERLYRDTLAAAGE